MEITEHKLEITERVIGNNWTQIKIAKLFLLNFEIYFY